MLNKYFDLIMPQITLPEHGEMIGDFYRIKSTDSFECREAMFMIARYFRREFRYDAIQYATLYDKEDDDECYAYAFTIEFGKRKSVVVGVVCFRKREWDGFGLQWMWLHPFIRNNGLLTKHWKLFREKFGNFYCEPPLSKPMKQFLKKIDKNGLHSDGFGKDVPTYLSRINELSKRHKSTTQKAG